MMQPIVAVPSGEGFEIVMESVDGEPLDAGFEVPVLVRTLGAEIAELALIENIQREELNQWSVPRALRRSPDPLA